MTYACRISRDTYDLAVIGGEWPAPASPAMPHCARPPDAAAGAEDFAFGTTSRSSEADPWRSPVSRAVRFRAGAGVAAQWSGWRGSRRTWSSPLPFLVPVYRRGEARA